MTRNEAARGVATQGARPCPQCGAPVVWGADAAFRPFCSERCRLIDLGAWAEGRYRIFADAPSEPGDSTPES